MTCTGARLAAFLEMESQLTVPFDVYRSSMRLRMHARTWALAFLTLVLGCGEPPGRQLSDELSASQPFVFEAWRTRLGGASASEIPSLNDDRDVIDLSGTDISDVDVESLQHFDQIKSLNISSTNLTDGAVENILMLGSLRELDLVFTQITGAGIRQLGSLPDLTTIHVWHDQLDENGLTGIGEMESLATIYLWVPDFGDEDENLPPKIKAENPDVHVEVMWYVDPMHGH